MIDLAAYWFVSHAIVKIFTADSGTLVRIETQSTTGLITDIDSSGTVIDSWQLSSDPLGVFEIADYIPPNTLVYKPGYEFPWGGHSMKEGDQIARSTGYVIGSAVTWGYAVTTFKEILPSYKVPAGEFKDVAKLDFLQYWCDPGNCKGGKKLWHGVFYLAKGIGLIEQDWLATPDGAGDIKLSSYSIQSP